jgi:hypothetical protein
VPYSTKRHLYPIYPAATAVIKINQWSLSAATLGGLNNSDAVHLLGQVSAGAMLLFNQQAGSPCLLIQQMQTTCNLSFGPGLG